jgi:hypothetical protein
MTLAVHTDNAVGTTVGAGTTAEAAVAQLIAGLSPDLAARVLAETSAAAERHTRDLAHWRELSDQLHGFFILLGSAFQALNGSKEPDAFTRIKLTEAERLAQQLTDPTWNNDAFWRAMVMSLRAECLHILGDEGAHAAALSAEAALQLVEPNASVDERRAYIAELLGTGNPRLTAVKFLDTLHAHLTQQ